MFLVVVFVHFFSLPKGFRNFELLRTERRKAGLKGDGDVLLWEVADQDRERSVGLQTVQA